MAQAQFSAKKRGGDGKAKAKTKYTGPAAGRPTSGGYAYAGGAAGKIAPKRTKQTGGM